MSARVAAWLACFVWGSPVALGGACAAASSTGSGLRASGLRLSCTPKDAAVALDGVPQGTCADYESGVGLAVPPGLHRIELTRDGYWPYVTYFDPSGARAVLHVQLTPAAKVP